MHRVKNGKNPLIKNLVGTKNLTPNTVYRISIATRKKYIINYINYISTSLTPIHPKANGIC